MLEAVTVAQIQSWERSWGGQILMLRDGLFNTAIKKGHVSEGYPKAEAVSTAPGAVPPHPLSYKRLL